METVVGGKLALATAAQPTTSSALAPEDTATTSAQSEAGKSAAQASRVERGPRRSTMRPSAGAAHASPATKQPAAAPPEAKEPLVPCTSSRIARPVIPIGSRPSAEAAKR